MDEKKMGLRDWLFLAAFALVVFLGTQLFLPPTAAVDVRAPPAPVEFDERVTQEHDPFIADVRAFTQLVEQRYAYLEHRRTLDGLDLAALEAAALEALGATPDEEAFRLAMRRFVAGLHDGHAWVRFAESRLPANRHWPFTALLVVEGVMIDGVHQDATELLQRGDLVLAVDGVEIERCIDEMTRLICASSDLKRRSAALKHLADWTAEAEIELTLERAGMRVSQKVPCPLRRLKIPRPGLLATAREEAMLDGDVAFFRPGSFLAPAESGWQSATTEEREEILSERYAQLERTFAGFTAARALVLDLRGNPGGTDLLGQALAKHLLEAGFTYYHLASLGGDGWGDFSATISSEPRPEHAFLGPLVCLIDERTFSAADNLAACLRSEHPDVTFVGRNTGSGTGAPRSFALPRTGTQVTLCTMRVREPGGSLIEGVGTAPDVMVTRTRDDVLAGRDAVLETALGLLSETHGAR